MKYGLLVPYFGVVGAAYAFALIYFLHPLAMLGLSRYLIGFRWSRSVQQLLVSSAIMVALGLGLALIDHGWIAGAGGGVLTFVGGIISLRGLGKRLGQSHKLIRFLPKYLLK